MKRATERHETILTLFDYEEKNNVPENRRYTYDANANDPKIPYPDPRKKAYADIRHVESEVKDLKHKGKL